jgi:hypothetical protein
VLFPCLRNIAKTDQKANVVLVDGVPLFFQLRDGQGWGTCHQLMTASMVHVTNLTPANGALAVKTPVDDMTAGMVYDSRYGPRNQSETPLGSGVTTLVGRMVKITD